MYDLFSDFFDGFDLFFQPTQVKEAKKCPVCGHTYEDFRRTGKIGCGECYNTFRSPIEQTLSRIHTDTSHKGKIPSKSGEALKLKRKYETLKEELAAAVRNEDYETAAKLHKQIREIENEVKKS